MVYFFALVALPAVEVREVPVAARAGLADLLLLVRLAPRYLQKGVHHVRNCLVVNLGRAAGGGQAKRRNDAEGKQHNSDLHFGVLD